MISGALGTGEPGPPPASEEAIGKLKRVSCCAAGQRCSICLCDLCTEGEDALQMPCEHTFHAACLTKWLRSHNTCPVCRHQIVVATAPAVYNPETQETTPLRQGREEEDMGRS